MSHFFGISMRNPLRTLAAFLLFGQLGLMAAVSVSISPSTGTLAAGSSQVFKTTVSGATDTSVTWKVVEGNNGGSVTSSGVYTAPETAGTYTVSATSVADPSKAATATVTVDTSTTTRVQLSPSEATVAPGGTQTFQATFSGFSGSLSYVGWRPVGGASSPRGVGPSPTPPPRWRATTP